VPQGQVAPRVPEVALNRIDTGGERLLQVMEVIAGPMRDRVKRALSRSRAGTLGHDRVV
jgi:hypothetical protein